MNVLLYGKSLGKPDIGDLLKTIAEINYVYVFEHFPQAREYLECNYAEVVILDADDADVSWRYLAKKFKKINEQIKVVLISDDNNKAVTAYETGVFDYLLKPVKKKQLERVIEKAADCGV